ncbi:MAG: hypothetical protein LUQ09_04725 [Methanomassiliicoccales archaeon]|nr:hypothetical protein [Methanomassiliicoccales archaeon]
MISDEHFNDMEVPEKALFVIRRYTDLFLGNLGIKLTRRELLSLMYEAKDHFIRSHQYDELLEVLTFLQETYNQDFSVEIGIVSDLKGLGTEAASALIGLEGEAHFNAGRYRHAMICYQILESYQGAGSNQDRIRECLERID